LAAQGAQTAADSAAAARAAEVVITMLPECEHVKAAILGENGVLAGARAGTVLIDMSSIAPHTTRQVAAEALARGLQFMDAPVSGGTTGAEQGTLTIMVGGDETLLEAHRPLLASMGKTIHHVGEIGMGETVKMINQVLVGINMLGIAEAFTLGTKLGADPEVLYKVIRASAGNSFLVDHRVPNYIFKGNFTQPGFALKLLMKDVGLAVESAKLQKVPLFLAGEVFQLLALAAGSGLADKDMSAVIELWEKAVGVQVRTD
jgi:3-hydroxyisobutyrate dehydrogenase-like beta-hydroxyacid dehydrogenase